MAPRVKYQVFISSTYEDLKDARLEVLKAILRNDHIPAGMEAFPATNDRGWEIIRRTIDESDYYVLLLGGLYGSFRESDGGPSWTEYEYNYALRRGLPVLAFIRSRASTPGNLIETDPKKAKCLQDFIVRVRSKHLSKTWGSPEELCGMVGESLRYDTTNLPGGDSQRPRGWIRGAVSPVERRWAGLFEVQRAVLPEPLEIPGKQPMPPPTWRSTVMSCDEETLRLELPPLPFGRVWVGLDGVEHHELHGRTERRTVALPWGRLESAEPSEERPGCVQVMLKRPLSYDYRSDAWV